MSTLDRSIPPVINPITNIRWPDTTTVQLSNGIPVTIIRNVDQPIVQIEIINRAGRILERRRIASRTTASMLKEGASGMKGQHISERVDYYGGSIVTSGSLDICRAQLFTMSKYEAETMPYLAAVWLDPDFPEEELLLLKQNRIQKLKEDLRRPDTVSYRNITEILFGEQHPYGYNSTPKLYEQLSLQDIRDHYGSAYGHDHMQIIATGNVTHETVSLLEQYFGVYRSATQLLPYIEPATSLHQSSYRYQIDDSYQTGIKIGRRIFNRQHPDYAGLFMLNVVLGGYFGSRLMSSIREEKGYTYNIFSSLGTLVHDGLFYISTEVDHSYVAATIDEVQRQLEILRTELVPQDELRMVKNYILGHLLGNLDGPFNMARLIKSYAVHHIGAEHFYALRDTVNTITSEELLQLACRYLQWDDMTIVEVG